MIAILVHGFNVWDPRKTVGKLRPFFTAAGVPHVTVNYGHFGLLETRFKNMKVAKHLAEVVSNARKGGERVIVVGHSNGCTITHLAAQHYGARIDLAVYINPALHKDLEPPSTIRFVHVWHSPDDKPVTWARWLPAADARPWGAMGAVGFTGHNSRVVNFDKQDGFRVSSRSHSDVFDEEKLSFFGPRIVRMATAGQIGRP